MDPHQQQQEQATASLVARALHENIYCPPPEPGQQEADMNPLCILLNRDHIKEASSDFSALCRSASRLSFTHHRHHHSTPASPRQSASSNVPWSQPVTPLTRSPVPGAFHPCQSRNSTEDIPPLIPRSHSTSNMLKKLAPFATSVGAKASSSGPLLRIITTENVLIFRGAPEESRGRILRGTVCLSLTSTLKVKGISLTFKGLERIDCYLESHAWDTFSSTARHLDETRELVSHTWSFLVAEPGQTKVLQPGSYAWPFEIALPGDLPESLITPYGHVSYTLRAEIERPTLCFNIVDKKRIVVQRYAVPNESHLLSEASLPPWYSGYHRESNLRYSVQVPNTVYAFDEVIPITVRLRNEVVAPRSASPVSSAASSTTLSPRHSRHPSDASRTSISEPTSPHESDGEGSSGGGLSMSASRSTVATTITSGDEALARKLSATREFGPHEGPAFNILGVADADRLRNLGCYSITASINEYTYYHSGDQQHQRRVSRVAAKTKVPVSTESSESGDLETTVYLRVPRPTHPGDFKPIVQNCRTHFMRIKHKIKVGIQVHQGELHGKILVTLPITLVVATIDHLLADPPVYKEDCLQEGDLVESASSTVPNSVVASPVLEAAPDLTSSLSSSSVLNPAASDRRAAMHPSAMDTSAAPPRFSVAPPSFGPRRKSASRLHLRSSSLQSLTRALHQSVSLMAGPPAPAVIREMTTTLPSGTTLPLPPCASMAATSNDYRAQLATRLSNEADAGARAAHRWVDEEVPQTPTSPPPCYSEFSSPALRGAESFITPRTIGGASTNPLHPASPSLSPPNVISF